MLYRSSMWARSALAASSRVRHELRRTSSALEVEDRFSLRDVVGIADRAHRGDDVDLGVVPEAVDSSLDLSNVGFADRMVRCSPVPVP